MVEGNLIVTYLIMLLAMLVDHRLPGHMMLKAVETFHYCVLQSKIYEDFNIIITHYIMKPSSVHFDMTYLLPDIENCNGVQLIRLHLGESRH